MLRRDVERRLAALERQNAHPPYCFAAPAEQQRVLAHAERISDPLARGRALFAGGVAPEHWDDGALTTFCAVECSELGALTDEELAAKAQRLGLGNML